MALINTELDILTRTLQKLDESEIPFYLTGSRFFLFSRDASDWDFYTGDSESTSNLLTGLGFVEINRIALNTEQDQEMYHDLNLARVFRHKCGVDVQMVKNVERKTQAQEIIKKYFLRVLWELKRDHKTRWLWDSVYRMMTDGVLHTH